MKRKGIFITFEGGEAVGKTTQIALLQEYLNSKMKDQVVFVHEPGGTTLGEKIRNLLLNDNDVRMCGKAELLLFMASRVELYEKVIKKALNEGKIVIADRYYDSTVAYQGNARKIMDNEKILSINKFFLDGLTPDLTIYLKMPAEKAFLRKGNSTLDKIELEGMNFHHAVTEGYDFMSKKEPERFFTIDASKTIEEIHKQIINKVNSLIKN